MDTELQKNEKSPSALEVSAGEFRPIDGKLLSGDPVQVTRCPECGSVFCDENVCEGCGLQLRCDRLGDPLSEKSFYWDQDVFWSSSLCRACLWVPSLSPIPLVTYQKKLERRFKALLEACEKGKVGRTSLYYLELKDLIYELVLIRCCEEQLWKMASEFSLDGALAKELDRIVKDAIFRIRQERFFFFTKNLFYLRILSYLVLAIFISYLLVGTISSF